MSDYLFKTIKSEIDYCETTRIPQNPNFTATELSRLDLIDKYMTSKYRDGDSDTFGNQMVFYNISSFPVEVASKQLDFDTKDILLDALDERYWETWLMEKELRMWMDEKKFGKLLNELTYRLPRDGHIVVKKVDDQVEFVPLKNLRFRPDALALNRTPIIEKYEYMADEFAVEAEKRGWENWQNVSRVPEKMIGKTPFDFSRTDKITVFGCWFPEGFLPGFDSNYFIVSYDGWILADWKQEFFYKGLSWEDVFGRLLGRGVVEKLFNEQIYLNRIANYKADGLNWSSKHYFQTRDNAFKTNLLGNSDNGDVFITNDEITPVAVEERNLAFYAQEEQRWEMQAMRRVFTTEPVTGARAPAGTPLGSSILQAQMTQGFYDQKKENLSIFIKEIIEDWIMPEFKKENRKEHKLMMKNLLTSERGSEKFFNLQLNYLLNKQKMTKFLSPEIWETKKVVLAEELKNKKAEIPKGFYDNLKYKMRIRIGSEAVDTAGKMTTLQTLLQIIGSNPAVFENKTTKNILYKMLEIAGFSPIDFQEEEPLPKIQDVVSMAQRGGSIAKPVSAPTQLQSPQVSLV